MVNAKAMLVIVLLLSSLFPLSPTLAQPIQGDELKIAYLAAQGSLFMGVFNPSPSGMTDVYTHRIWYFLNDPPYVMGPDGSYHSYRCQLVSVNYNVQVPGDAVIWNDTLGEWTSPYAGRTARSAVTWKCGLGTWVDGQKITLADYLFAYAMDWEWSHEGGAYYDQSWSASEAGKLQGIYGLEVKAVTSDYVEFTVYQDYAVPYSRWATAVNYVPYPEFPWQLYYAASELVAKGYGGKMFSWSSKSVNGYQLNLIDEEQMEYISGMLSRLKDEAPIPGPLSELSSVLGKWGLDYYHSGLQDAESGYSALIGWISNHKNALVTNGPYYVEDYDAEDMKLVLKLANNRRVGFPDTVNGKTLPWEPYWREIDVYGVLNDYTAILSVAKGEYDLYWFTRPYSTLSSVVQEYGKNINLIKAIFTWWSINLNLAGDSTTGLVETSNGTRFNPFALREVRFAMNWLINRQYIVSQILQGSGAPIYGPNPTGQVNAHENYVTVAKAMGITSQGDENYAIKMIDEAMTRASSELSDLGHTLEKRDGVWYFDGQPVTVKIIARVEDERLDEGKYLAQILQKAGFKVDLLQWQRSQASRMVYSSDPKELQWHVYTEGWVVSGIQDITDLAWDFWYYGSYVAPNWGSNYHNPVTVRDVLNAIASGDVARFISELNLKYYNTPNKLKPLLDWTGYDLANLLAYAKWTKNGWTVSVWSIDQFWDLYKLAYALHLYNAPRIYTAEVWNFYITNKRVKVGIPDPVTGLGSFLAVRSLEPAETSVSGGTTGTETTTSASPQVQGDMGTIEVVSIPAGAEVYVDGGYQGIAPINVSVSPGTHRVQVKMPGYEEYSTTVTVDAGKTVVLNVNLEPKSGTLVVDSTPSGASVYVDGTYRGTTPLTVELQPGQHTINVTLEGYKPYLATVNVPPGETVKITAKLEKKIATGTVWINSQPTGADVYVDGTWRGTTPLTLTLPPGTHTIEIRKEGYPPTRKTVEVAPGEEKKITLTLAVVTSQDTQPKTTSESTPANAVPRKAIAVVLAVFILVGAVLLLKRSRSGGKTQNEPSKGSIEGFPAELLDRYEPLEFLGEGGFAKVFKVKRKKDGKTVALKIPRIDEKTSKTFLREVSTWFQLNHPNVVKLYDADILPVPHLEMEFVEGAEVDGKLVRTLEELPKPVDEKTALGLIKGIAEGLKHAHSKGIVHRDLKPGNILLKANLTPKITDWGLAKIGTMSSGRSVMGYTPLYAAPEHLMPSRFGSTDHRTDVWQLGTIFYELLTGRVPFEGYTYEEVFGKITDENYRHKPPSDFNPALAKYDGLFEKLLAKRKEDRYGSVEEFLEDLEKLRESERRREELESQVDELKKTLTRSVEALKKSRSADETLKNRRLVVETLGRLALAYAELNRKAELLNTLNDLKFYTVQNINDLTKAITIVETLLRENLPVEKDFVERLKVLVHNIKRENEAN